MGPAALLATMLLLGTAPAGGAARERIVVVPFENLPRAGAARPVVTPAVEAALAEKGYEVVAGEATEEFLHARRIRYLDSLTAAQAVELQLATGADAALVGSIVVYDGREADPQVALAAKVIGSKGDVLWSNVEGLTAAQTEGAFGLGKAKAVDEVARRAVRRLLEPLPRGKLAPVRVDRPAGGGAPPRVYRAREQVGKHLRICVLPLVNLTDDRDAPRVLDAVLEHRLSERSDVTAVQPAELRAAIVEAKLRAPSQMSPDQLREVGKIVGTPLFLRGTILGFGRSSAEGVSAPEIEIYLTLVDVESGRTLWSGLHRRSGAEYEKLLRFGVVREQTSLANRVVAELIEAFTRS